MEWRERALLAKTESQKMLEITLQQTRFYQEIKEEGRQEEAANIVIRLLTKLTGQKLSTAISQQISSLPLSVLEDLSEALLDFTSLADLQVWLDTLYTEADDAD